VNKDDQNKHTLEHFAILYCFHRILAAQICVNSCTSSFSALFLCRTAHCKALCRLCYTAADAILWRWWSSGAEVIFKERGAPKKYMSLVGRTYHSGSRDEASIDK